MYPGWKDGYKKDIYGYTLRMALPLLAWICRIDLCAPGKPWTMEVEPIARTRMSTGRAYLSGDSVLFDSHSVFGWQNKNSPALWGVNLDSFFMTPSYFFAVVSSGS